MSQSVVDTATRLGAGRTGVRTSLVDFLIYVHVQTDCRFRPAFTLREGADKSLARPGRKQATVSKLGIYSPHCSRSSVHFLVGCSNFCKPLKTNSEGCPSNQVFVAAMTSASENKWRYFNCFLVQGTGGSPTGQDPENRVGDQYTGSQDRPHSSGLQVPGQPGHCRARTRPPW